ncbi:hypothetical protein WR25_23576 [Diploscapter pachys]|uniref:Uncharacterized protein n=1 Tax=Diploscapter pachys TaxID=2018661 RepID=A0A2A2M610_9BILA|nr:hypothetical protein WR25_23576 [Diploscapter pachys]
MASGAARVANSDQSMPSVPASRAASAAIALSSGGKISILGSQLASWTRSCSIYESRPPKLVGSGSGTGQAPA